MFPGIFTSAGCTHNYHLMLRNGRQNYFDGMNKKS